MQYDSLNSINDYCFGVLYYCTSLSPKILHHCSVSLLVYFFSNPPPLLGNLIFKSKAKNLPSFSTMFPYFGLYIPQMNEIT